jgi:type VI secretion system FHA domain protein
MQLSMTVLRCPDQVAPEARTVSGGEFHVGRGPDVDWVLPDPDRLLSKRHFAVAFRGGSWQVADTSTNGTYLNTEPDAIGRGAPRSLRDGDRLRLGAYEIEIRLADQPAHGDARGGQGSSQGGGPGGGMAGFGGGGRVDHSPFGDPFADDPLAPTPAARRPFDEPAYQNLGMAPTSAQLPHDFDPLAPDHDDAAFGGGFRGPAQSDHSSSMDDAMIPPPVAEYVAPHAGGIIPGDDLLPDDWDKDLLEGIGQPAASPAPFANPAMPGPAATPFASPPPVMPPPVIPPPGPQSGAPPLDPRSSRTPPPAATRADASPFGMAQSPPPAAPEAFREPLDFTEPLAPQETTHWPSEAEPVSAPPVVAAPVVRQRTPRPATPQSASLEADPFSEMESQPARQLPPTRGEHPAPPAASLAASPFDEPSDPPRSEPVSLPATMSVRPVEPPRAAAAAPAGDDGGALAAFFKGAELSGASPADPIAMMTGLGEAFRALVSGLRAVLIARATIKGEFRIEQTMIRARGNNPLKFSANDDDALTALLGVGRRTDMAPAVAIEDSLRDLRMHEVATMAAMQVAVRAMLDELSPDKIRAGTDQGGMAVLPAQRKARAWDVFEARHAHVVQALVDDFDSIFGKSFARAYERALDEISTRERQ